jgi:hypothetical protein
MKTLLPDAETLSAERIQTIRKKRHEDLAAATAAGGIRLEERHSSRDAFTAPASLSPPPPRAFRRAAATVAVPAGISLPVAELH